MYCVALYIGYRCMSCVVYQAYVYAFVVSHVVCGCMSCDVHCVCIRVVLYFVVHYCVVLYIGCGCMCCMSSVGVCIAWCGMFCVVVCVGCTLCVCAHG